MSTALLNLYDYTLIVFLVFFACVGLARGFWTQFFSIVIWGLGGVFYYFFGAPLEQVQLSKYMSLPAAHWFTLVIVLMTCFFINFLVRFLLSSLFNLNPFTFFNKLGGLILGLVSSSLIVLLVVYWTNSSDIAQDAGAWDDSYIVTKANLLLGNLNEHTGAKVNLSGAASSGATAIPPVTNAEAVA